MSKLKSALYPGTFDALTYGHLDIINRGARIFDRFIVAVAYNDKKKPMFSIPEREDALREETRSLSNVEITHFSGLTVDFARKVGASVIVRGLRVASDFEFELQMAVMNRIMTSEIDTLFLAPSVDTLFVSSTLVKEILLQGGDISRFVPPTTERMLRRKFNVPDSGTQGEG